MYKLRYNEDTIENLFTMCLTKCFFRLPSNARQLKKTGMKHKCMVKFNLLKYLWTV